MNISLSHLPIAVILVISIASMFALLSYVTPHLQQLAYAASQGSALKQGVKEQMGQDNLCHRSDGCNQANEGQQITGNDNTAAGFNDQSTNSNTLSTTNATSSSGAQGPAGPAGPQGEPGGAGPTQTAVTTQRVGTPTTITPNNFGGAEALCNPGEVVTGGGYAFTPAGLGVTHPIIDQFRAIPNPAVPGWQISAFNPGTANTTISVFAQCLDLVP